MVNFMTVEEKKENKCSDNGKKCLKPRCFMAFIAAAILVIVLLAVWYADRQNLQEESYIVGNESDNGTVVYTVGGVVTVSDEDSLTTNISDEESALVDGNTSEPDPFPSLTPVLEGDFGSSPRFPTSSEDSSSDFSSDDSVLAEWLRGRNILPEMVAYIYMGDKWQAKSDRTIAYVEYSLIKDYGDLRFDSVLFGDFGRTAYGYCLRNNQVCGLNNDSEFEIKSSTFYVLTPFDWQNKYANAGMVLQQSQFMNGREVVKWSSPVGMPERFEAWLDAETGLPVRVDYYKGAAPQQRFLYKFLNYDVNLTIDRGDQWSSQ